MADSVYEFPLNEKVRTYLRLEQLFKQLTQNATFSQDWQAISFFESLFTLVELLDRVDIRNDILKDFDQHEKNLVYWSQHPQIDTKALEQALKKIINLRESLKSARKIGSNLKEDKFLSSIKQRFSIPGATCSFDLPNLHFWLRQDKAAIEKDVANWLGAYDLIKESIETTLAFMRERGKFETVEAENGFHQGIAEDRVELIRIHCATDQGYYPTLSGNKYRYAIRFMYFDVSGSGQVSVESTVSCKIACC